MHIPSQNPPEVLCHLWIIIYRNYIYENTIMSRGALWLVAYCKAYCTQSIIMINVVYTIYHEVTNSHKLTDSLNSLTLTNFHQLSLTLTNCHYLSLTLTNCH